jgi:hypothetical protein
MWRAKAGDWKMWCLKVGDQTLVENGHFATSFCD